MNGGGYFTAQNKVVPGAYINFVSTTTARGGLSDRGVVAMAMSLGWGVEGSIIEVTSDVLANPLATLGYSFDSEVLKPIREVMKHARKLLLFRLDGNGTKASNAYGTAKYAGVRGNDLKVVISVNADAPSKYDVKTYLGTELVDSQSAIEDATALKDNDFIAWNDSASLSVTAGTALNGGTNGAVNGSSHSAFLNLLESESFNVLVTDSTETAIKSLYVAFTKRMVEEVGVKFQTVLFERAADAEYIINETTAADLVYWVAGAEAGCAINQSITNLTYDGEYEITKKYTQAELAEAIDAGEFVFHKVGSVHKVLTDINSLVSVTEAKGDDFKNNQTVRVINQIGNDVAALFNGSYLGKVQNDEAGRASFWGALVGYFNDLLQLRAIQNFDANTDVVVEAGQTPEAVLVTTQITPVSCMEKLYMVVYVN